METAWSWWRSRKKQIVNTCVHNLLFNITVYIQYQQNNITIYFKDGKKSICTVTNDTLNKFTQLSQQILPSKA